MDHDELFPTVRRSIENLINDEEGNIPRGKLLAVGTVIILLSTLLSFDAFAGHSSHKSHSSHSSHSSSSYHRSHVSHTSHNSHTSHSNTHGNHVSHGSHTSHSNTAQHSNSNYSAAGDYNTPTAPAAGSIQGVQTPNSTGSAGISSQMPVIDLSTPEATLEVAGTIPVFATPLDTPETTIPSADVPDPPDTPDIHE